MADWVERADDDSRRVAPAVVEHELRLVEEAIAMVASGAAPRVTLAGLRFGDQIVATAQLWAEEAGVRATPLWRTDESGLDLLVEPPTAEPATGEPSPAEPA